MVSAALAQIGEFSFILIGLAIHLGLIPAEAQSLVVAGAIISIIVNPFAFVAVARWLPTSHTGRRNNPISNQGHR
jgi:CPA2 family monovalent cation:H+ antiporter-2